MCDTIRNNIEQLIKKKKKNFFFFSYKKFKKSLGSAPKNRDGRVTGSKAGFFFRPYDSYEVKCSPDYFILHYSLDL